MIENGSREIRTSLGQSVILSGGILFLSLFLGCSATGGIGKDLSSLGDYIAAAAPTPSPLPPPSTPAEAMLATGVSIAEPLVDSWVGEGVTAGVIALGATALKLYQIQKKLNALEPKPQA